MKNKKKPTLKKLPKYGFGGDIKDIAKNYARGMGDVALSAVGASNVIQDDDYTGKGSEFMRGYSNVVGSAAKAALPIAANLVAPGVGGMIAKGVQSVGGTLNPEDNSIDPKTGLPYGQQTKALGQAAGQLAPVAGMMFPMGGMTPPTQQFDGPSHAQGGIPLMTQGGPIEIEKQEVTQSLPDGSQRILSDNKALKLPSTGKNPAQSFKPFQNIKDKIAKLREGKYIGKEAAATAKLNEATADKKYDGFYNEQEALKQAKVQAYAKKMGLDISNQQFSMGGTKLPQYEDGGKTYSPVRNNPFITNNLNLGKLGNQLPYMLNGNNANYNNQEGQENFNIDQSEDRFMNTPSNLGTYNTSEIIPSPQPRDWRTPAGAAFSGLAQSVDEMMYLKDQGKRYDKVDYGTVTPEKLNPREAILQAQMQARLTRNALKDQTGGNAGSYLSNLTGAQANNTMNIAKINQDYDNTNAQIANQAKYANQGYKIQGMTDEAANKGQALTNYYQAIGEIGNNTAGAYKDYKSGKMDIATAKMLGSMFTNFGLDINNPNHYFIFYKKMQESGQLGASGNSASTPPILPGVPTNPNTRTKQPAFSIKQENIFKRRK